ncbi:MAG: Gfo/Idh/MocA family oxidoreductase [Planctomycetota bacterium]
MSAIKIGVMGCGVVSEYGHLPPLRDNPRFDVQSLMDPNKDRVEDYARRFGVPQTFTDQDGFMNSGLDAVAICSPAPVHLANIKGCAEHGLAALCEKPLAMDADEAQEIVDIMNKADLPLYVGFCYRFAGCAQTIRDLVQDGAIGQVRSLRLIYNWDCHGKYEQDATGKWVKYQRRIDRMLEGGPMVDCGVHQIDLAQWWLQSPVVRYTGQGSWVDEYEAPDHVFLHMDHDNGAHTMVEMSYSYGHTTKNKYNAFIYELIGTDGIIRYERNTNLFELRTDQFTEKLKHTGEKNFAVMYDHFADALQKGDPGDLCTGEEAIVVTDIARHATDAVIANRISKPVVIGALK